MIDNPPSAALASTPQTLKVACLRVGREYYALDIMCIREIIRPLPIVPVPKAPVFVDGVIHLRKAVIPVVDLRRRFSLSPAPQEETKRRIIICVLDGRVAGLVADEVTEVYNCRQTDIRPTPYYLNGPEAELFPGICRKGNDLLLLLDLRKILTSSRRIDLDHVREQLEPEREQ